MLSCVNFCTGEHRHKPPARKCRHTANLMKYQMPDSHQQCNACLPAELVSGFFLDLSVLLFCCHSATINFRAKHCPFSDVHSQLPDKHCPVQPFLDRESISSAPEESPFHCPLLQYTLHALLAQRCCAAMTKHCPKTCVLPRSVHICSLACRSPVDMYSMMLLHLSVIRSVTICHNMQPLRAK